MTFDIECAFRIGDVAAAEMWCHLSSIRPDVLHPDRKGDLYGNIFSVDQIKKRLTVESRPYFTVEFDNGFFDYGPLGAYGFSNLQILKCNRSIEDACLWMSRLAALPSFIQGRLYDEEYEFWQNASDPLEYKAKNQPYDHLPMKNNGLPPPLEQMEIDTSSNPGRRILRTGFIEAVGSMMWLADDFLKLVNITEAELQAQDWLNPQRLPSGVWKIQAYPTPFTSDEGEQRALQEKMRDFLFGAVTE